MMLPRAQAVVVMYLGASLIGVVIAVVVRSVNVSPLTAAFIVLTGFLTASSAYCQWQCYAHSLSKTSLFFPAADALAALLAALFLGEALLYRPGVLVAGLLLLYTAAVMLSWRSGPWQWRWWLVGMLLTSGFVGFLMKMFSADVPVPAFLLWHYTGATVGASALWFLQRERWAITWRSGSPVLLISLAIVGALGMSYWALGKAPAGVVLPLQSFGASVLAILAGWILFREVEKIRWHHVVGFTVGIIGLVLIYLAQFLESNSVYPQL